MKVDNAIIMAAGTASRFAPLSYEVPKALIEVRGEVLIERQIRQLKEAGIDDVIIVTGYKAKQFGYLVEKYGVKLVHNTNYLTHNNNSSIWVVRDYLKNSYICSSDNYFFENPFETEVDDSYYSAIYVDGDTNEWCIEEENGKIRNVIVGGRDSWVMLGHVFWSEQFSKDFIAILEAEHDKAETADKLWETIYIDHIGELDMKIRKYPSDYIFEFDTLDDLRLFDETYISNTRSSVIKGICETIGVNESEVIKIKSFKDENNAATGFTFEAKKQYIYYYKTGKLEEI